VIENDGSVRSAHDGTGEQIGQSDSVDSLAVAAVRGTMERSWLLMTMNA
jgi:hypothetical protein